MEYSERKNWKTYAFWIAITAATGGLSALLTRKGMEYYNASVVKPPLTPPGVVFGIAWAILYLLMAVGMARVWLRPASKARSRGLFFFLLQLAFNFFWSLIFFNLRMYFAALVWLAALWVFILEMTLSFREADALAAGLQIPYLLWVLFAGYLNFGVWILNR